MKTAIYLITLILFTTAGTSIGWMVGQVDHDAALEKWFASRNVQRFVRVVDVCPVKEVRVEQ